MNLNSQASSGVYRSSKDGGALQTTGKVLSFCSVNSVHAENFEFGCLLHLYIPSVFCIFSNSFWMTIFHRTIAGCWFNAGLDLSSCCDKFRSMIYLLRFQIECLARYL